MAFPNSASWPFATALAASIVIGTLLGAADASAQTGAMRPTARATRPAVACLDTVSLAPSIPTIAFLGGSVPDSTDAAFADMGDQFTQSVSQHMRKLLGGSGSVLPRGEPAITWRHIESHPALRVTVRREGAPTLTLLRGDPVPAADALILKAAQQAIAGGEGTFWPGTTPGDSADYEIWIALPPLGQLIPTRPMRTVFPTFSLLFPPYTPVAASNTSTPADPFAGSNNQASAEVVTDFDVDSMGRVIPSSIIEVWPPLKVRPTGKALETYSAFLNSVVNWLPTATFVPARIGGCPIRQSMRLPITFGVVQ